MAHRILIADHDLETREALESFLGKTMGYEVAAAATGEKAIELAGGKSFDLCIIDTHPPDLTCVETYQRIFSILPKAEYIFLSGGEVCEKTQDFLRFTIPSERLIEKPILDVSAFTRLIIGILGPPVVKI